MKNSIIHNTETVLEDLGSNITDLFCLAVNESTSVTGALVDIRTPDFVDVFNDNYHLDINSEVNGWCLMVGGSTLLDSDNEPRGFDHPDHNHGGLDFLRDAGADEVVIDGVIFRNGFE